MQTLQSIKTTQELIEECAKNDKKYLTTLEIYENQALQKVIKDLQSVGLDPVDILKKAYKGKI